MSSNVTFGSGAAAYDFGQPISATTTNSTTRAITHGFNVLFDTSFQGRAELLNALQYALLIAFPTMLLVHGLHLIVPAPNYTATILMLVLEILFQIALTVTSFVLLHRAVTLVPTISGVQYERINYTSSAFALLFIMFSLHSKLSAKGHLILERLGWYSAPAAANGRHPTTATAAAHPGIASSSVGTMLMRPAIDPASGIAGERVIRPMGVPR